MAAIQSRGAAGRIRARVLPESIRKTDPYSSPEKYEVRYEASESPQAKAVGELAESVISASGSFNLRQIAPVNPTPWYLSVFICPEPTGSASSTWSEASPRSGWCYQEDRLISGPEQYSVHCHWSEDRCNEARGPHAKWRQSSCGLVELSGADWRPNPKGWQGSWFEFRSDPFPDPFPKLP